MPYVKRNGPYSEFISERDVDSALHYEDGSDDVSIGFVRTLKEGDVEIDQSEYDTIAAAIVAYNEALPSTIKPPPDWFGLRVAVLVMPEFGETDIERLINVNALFAKWPTANVSLETQNLAVLQGTLTAMLTVADIDQTLYDAFQNLMAEHNIIRG